MWDCQQLGMPTYCGKMLLSSCGKILSSQGCCYFQPVSSHREGFLGCHPNVPESHLDSTCLQSVIQMPQNVIWMTESQESFLGGSSASHPSQDNFRGGSDAGGGIDSAAFLASTSTIVQLSLGSGCSVGFFLKQQLQQLLSQHSQLQLVTPIMMRMTARRKKTRPERL